jgi:hypothetical protein
MAGFFDQPRRGGQGRARRPTKQVPLPPPRPQAQPDGDYTHRRRQIQDHYRRIIELDAEHRALVERAAPILPVFRSYYDILFSDLHRVVHRVIGYDLKRGDWYFSDYAARDMDVWTRVHAAWVAISSYLEDMEKFGMNEETRERLGTPRGGNAVRLANLNSWRNQLHQIFNPRQEFSGHPLPRVAPEEVDSRVVGLEHALADHAETFRDLNISLSSTGRLPDYGTAYGRLPGVSVDSTRGSYGWGGVPGAHYRKLVDDQRKAAERMAQISDYMLQAVQTVRSSYNDLLSSIEILLVIVIAFSAAVLGIMWQKYRALVMALLAAVGLGPGAPAAQVAVRASVIMVILTFISTAFLQSAALTNGFITLIKNESTLAPARARYLNQIDTWKTESSRLPSNRWPNPLKDVGTPVMVFQPGEGWRVGYRPEHHGLRSALEYGRQAPDYDERPWYPRPWLEPRPEPVPPEPPEQRDPPPYEMPGHYQVP